MTDLLVDWAWKSTALLGAAWIAIICLRGHSAALRHRIWALTLTTLILAPVISLYAPVWHTRALSVPVRGLSKTAAVQDVNVTFDGTTAELNRPPMWPRAFWLGGVSLLLLRLLVGTLWIRRRAQPLLDINWQQLSNELGPRFGVRRPVRLLKFTHYADAMPVTWGLSNPAIVLPDAAAEWPEERRRIVLSHELAHIGRRDWGWQMCAEIAKALYWFHPFVWLAARQLRRESETACDDSLLISGIPATDYATELLDLSHHLKTSVWHSSTALAMARTSDLERRFTSMLNPLLNRHRLSRKGQLITALTFAALLIPVAALRAPAQGQAGKLTGTVYDPDGAVIANANVILIGPNFQIGTRADLVGRYSFTGFPAGIYEVEVQQPGFQRFRNTSVALNAGQETSLNIGLSVGRVTQNIEVVGSGVPPVATVRTAQAKPIRVGGNVQAARLLKQVKPVYPPVALAAGTQGTVILEAQIGADGTLTSLKLLNSVDAALDQAAITAVQQWQYQPTLLNGEPVPVTTNISVNFKLP